MGRHTSALTTGTPNSLTWSSLLTFSSWKKGPTLQTEAPLHPSGLMTSDLPWLQAGGRWHWAVKRPMHRLEHTSVFTSGLEARWCVLRWPQSASLLDLMVIDWLLQIQQGRASLAGLIGRAGESKFKNKLEWWSWLGHRGMQAREKWLEVNSCPGIILIIKTDVFKKKRLKAGREGDDRGWDGCMASPTQWTWVWASSRIWWRTGKPGVLQFMGSQGVRQNWVTEQETELFCSLELLAVGSFTGDPMQGDQVWFLIRELLVDPTCWN